MKYKKQQYTGLFSSLAMKRDIFLFWWKRIFTTINEDIGIILSTISYIAGAVVLTEYLMHRNQRKTEKSTPWFSIDTGVLLSALYSMLVASNEQLENILPAYPDTGSDILFYLLFKCNTNYMQNQ